MPRFSDLFCRTLREAPAEAHNPIEGLMARAGMLRIIEGGRIYLPLALRVLERIERDWLVAFERLGAGPAHWPQLVSLDKVIRTVAQSDLQSYKQLPARLYFAGSSTGVGAQPSRDTAGGGGMNGALCLAVSLLTFESSAEALEATLAEMRARTGAFASSNLQVQWTHPEVDSRWAVCDWEYGSDTLLYCSACGYAALEQDARVLVTPLPPEEPRPLEKVATPACKTIQDLAVFLGIPASRTAKAVFYHSGEKVVFAVIRGDLNINESRLRRAVQLDDLEPAGDADILRVGAVPGYASPIGVHGAQIVVDPSVVNSPNLVAGANQEGFHLWNTNTPRDYAAHIVAAIAQARAGDPCPECAAPLGGRRVARLARTAELETDTHYLDAQGRPARVRGGVFQFDAAAFLDLVVARHHDEKGLVWPDHLAPLDAHMVALNPDKPEVSSAVAQACEALREAGRTWLLDDRAESAGVKFNDADLIGLPWRITAGPRTVAQGAVELKRRTEAKGQVIPLAELASRMSYDRPEST